ncbi:MAG: TetR family transcriptional regulator [Mesorhizobium sp.]|uniref:TetR family transcriptional regulator n=1 Tax=Mesorhizobium sp. M1E.F.Ca.ET.045.02.1.1 TaxID=2493672 RepID=UPI000F7546FA|nr:TetR family transcriptional regulator [Mesorhizobium sp. M1E.F.Ca.ET.045.02.1.1]AZO19832.1 TetR family transcriptional regulator [Mesorhizobium sp. M1E.F.Ca.ET.045.02.1.1]TIU30715.1 MAG: TetR family transcriptional regulator [Mesorhizobium sp.]TKB14969.1 MAG: TetR family transcriptional regulator [Mesorhizobium sp.]
MRRTKAEAEQTREAVLAAAIDVFLERGVTRATLEQIASAAGVTRGAVYWHFRDKQEIFTALERRANMPNEEFGDRLTARLATQPDLDPLRELADVIRDGLQAFETHPERSRILTILWLRCEYSEDMLPVVMRQREADLALQKLFESVIALAATRGRLAPALSPELAARALLLLVNGSVLDWLRAPGQFELTTSTMPMVAGFLEAISAPKVQPAADHAANMIPRSMT